MRAALALIVNFLCCQIASADCDTHINDNDHQNVIQAKMDCLVKENQTLRNKLEAGGHPSLSTKIFTINSPQEALQLKANLFAWVTSQHGTMISGSSLNQPKVGGYVGSVTVGAGCDDRIGVCIVAASGLSEQAVAAAVQAIHSGYL